MIDLKLRRIGYTLLYSYIEPTEVRWRYAGGDVRDVTGSYTFRETGPTGIVEATHKLDVEFGFPVPALVQQRLQREVMRRSVRELKARVESGA